LKNFPVFIKIISELKQDFPDIKVVIIGDGPEKNKLLKISAELNVSENISFTGVLPHDEVVNFLYRSKVLLHTSLAEGQAAVFSEALYCGLNVLCSDVGRIENIIKMHICNSELEMVEKMKILLTSELNFEPVLLRTIDDTVNDCISLLK
jgi:glycosyltransferase involved in cell wall biosynthesis